MLTMFVVELTFVIDLKRIIRKTVSQKAALAAYRLCIICVALRVTIDCEVIRWSYLLRAYQSKKCRHACGLQSLVS